MSDIELQYLGARGEVKTQVLIFEPSLYINLFKIHWSRYSDMAMLFDRHPKFLCQVVFTALCITLS